MPKHWFSDEYAEKHKRCGVPKDAKFQTEPVLALEMVSDVAKGEQLPFQWVVADEHYGMDHYETRTWRGWHHQMTLTFLAHHFLLWMRLRLQKKARR